MDAETITSYAWIAWAALILVFVIIEIFTLDLTFLMIAIGSVGGLVASLFDVPWWWQILIVAVLSLLLLFAVRPPLLRALRRGGDPTLTGVDRLLGATGTVQADFAAGTGHVKLSNGETWTARLAPGIPAAELETGDLVVVTAIDGATAVVEPSGRNTL